MKGRVDSLLAEVRRTAEQPAAFGYLPDIALVLERMKTSLDLGETSQHRERLAASLGRLVTEQMSFAESPLGGALLRLADPFRQLRNWNSDT